MAKKKKKDDKEIEVNAWERWRNDEEKELVQEILTRFQQMEMARNTSCYWGAGSGELKSWSDRWSRDEKLAIMWRGDMGDDDNLTNFKSPISWGALQAFMAEFSDGMLDANFKGVEEEDKTKAFIVESAMNYAAQQNDFGSEHRDIAYRFAMKGTAVAYACYMKRSYMAEFPKTDEKSMTDDEKKMVKSGKPVTEKREVVDYDDIAIIPIRLEEFYIDPNARCLKGKAFEARDCVWRTPMTPEQVRQEFGDNKSPYVIRENLDKVKSGGEYMDDDGFFEPPEDIEMSQCQVLRYYNKYEDRYEVVANDVLIYKGPNPHPHKQLPFEMKSFFPHPDSPYGIGFPAILEGIQSEDEVIRNANIQRLLITLNLPMLINDRIYGEFVGTYQRTEPNMLIKVHENTDVTWMPTPPPAYEIQPVINQLREDAIVASGIDPRKSGLAVKSATATDAMINKEATKLLIKKLIERYVEFAQGLYRLLYAEMRKNYTVSRVEEITDGKESRKQKVNRKIRLKNKKIRETDDGMQVENINGYSWFELKKEYFDFKQDPDIYIDPEMVVSVSKGLDMQKSEQVLKDLAPFAGDPSNVPPGQPKPPVDLIEALRWYIETHDAPDRLMTVDDIDEEEEIDRALEQNKEIQGGTPVSGIPGESIIHKMTHEAQLEQVNNAVTEMEKVLQSPNANMMMGSYRELAGKYEQLKLYQQLLARHLMVDDMPRGTRVQAAVQAGMPPQQPGPGGSGPTQGPAGGMAQQPGSPLGGTQGPSQQAVYGEPKPQPQISPVV